MLQVDWVFGLLLSWRKPGDRVIQTSKQNGVFRRQRGLQTVPDKRFMNEMVDLVSTPIGNAALRDFWVADGLDGPPFAVLVCKSSGFSQGGLGRPRCSVRDPRLN